jgi:ketosteroid isomerase-like protein
VSQANVAVVRESLERYVATGEPDPSALDEDVVIYDHDILDAGDYRGHDGYARWFEDFGAAWSDFALSIEEYLDIGEHVVVVFRIKAVGAASGIAVERQDAMVCRMRDLKVVRIDYFNNRDQAFKAVGLDE